MVIVKWMLWQWHAAVRVLLSAILKVGTKRWVPCDGAEVKCGEARILYASSSTDLDCLGDRADTKY